MANGDASDDEGAVSRSAAPVVATRPLGPNLVAVMKWGSVKS